MTTAHGADEKNPTVVLIRRFFQKPQHHLAVTHQQTLRFESE